MMFFSDNDVDSDEFVMIVIFRMIDIDKVVSNYRDVLF